MTDHKKLIYDAVRAGVQLAVFEYLGRQPIPPMGGATAALESTEVVPPAGTLLRATGGAKTCASARPKPPWWKETLAHRAVSGG
ncbi:hypothetical protein SAMN04488026_102013 [Aliiruegeria lutimaris]|uniref:Uncharacterized protein n=1 Tax=Aliiruegeria lutimaris TaxID=571298 RepID=A0A1G8UWS6_9RHOB|nr:hypothetical protein SAMN04488026_102013 [Aliiruegeria lutimaris]